MSRHLEETEPMPMSGRSRSKKKPGRGGPGCMGRAFFVGLLLFAFLVFGGIGVTFALVSSNLSAELQEGIDTLATARDRRSFQTTIITDRNGETLWEIFGEGKRTNVPLSQMPLEIKAATIAVEDDTFYTNKGFDEPSIAAAMLANYRNPEARPIGGSTITQQLVRHIAFSNEDRLSVNYRRKVKELFLAWRMTREFSKDEILEMYLNEIYYGNLAYGIEAASQTYFDKSATDLTLGEATLLAGLPQAPIGLDPYLNFEAAKARQWFILNLMFEDGMVNRQQMDEAYLEELVLAEQSISLKAPHFTIAVRQELEKMLGADVVANDGLRVRTSLDLRYQTLAETLAREHVSALAANNLTNAALVAMKPGTGEVLALVGSVDYRNEAISGQVNVALSQQQPGSTFKPLTFALALENGWRAGDVVWDVPVQYPQLNGSIYEPVNYDGRFHGPMRLREALANSYNIPAIALADAVGVENLLTFSRAIGLDSLSEDLSLYGLSLTLGGAEVTQLEMTRAYAAFANGGTLVEPVTILEVTDANGEVVFVNDSAESPRVMSQSTAYIVSDMLADDEARIPAMGVDSPLDLPFTAAVKTGTTNDFRDNWTIGYTPGLVVSVWAGNTDNSPMVDVSGLSGAAPLWNAYMQAVYGEADLRDTLAIAGLQPPDEFIVPNTVTEVAWCDLAAVTVDMERCDQTIMELDLVDGAAELPEPTERIEWLDATVLRTLSAPSTQPVAEGGYVPPFCRVEEGRWPGDTRPRVFIVAPGQEPLASAAYKWAAEAGVMIAPAATCGGAVADNSGPWTATPGAVAAVSTVAPESTPAPGNTATVVQNAPAVTATPWPTVTPQPIVASTQVPTAVPTAIPTPIPPTPTAVVVPMKQSGGAQYGISSPLAGGVYDTAVPVMGSAEFDPSVVQFYKIELRKAAGGNWVTLGNAHNLPVTNGFLEMLPVDALLGSADWGAGDYLLRLVLVRWDGNDAGEPFVVPISLR